MEPQLKSKDGPEDAHPDPKQTQTTCECTPGCEKGRPKGVTPKYSLKPLVPRLSELLGLEVVMADDYISEKVQKLVSGLPEGGVLLLENVRF